VEFEMKKWRCSETLRDNEMVGDLLKLLQDWHFDEINLHDLEIRPRFD
jgi:hypothetical protein